MTNYPTSRELITETAEVQGWEFNALAPRCSQFTKGEEVVRVNWSANGQVTNAVHLRMDRGFPKVKKVPPNSKRSHVITWLALEG